MPRTPRGIQKNRKPHRLFWDNSLIQRLQEKSAHVDNQALSLYSGTALVSPLPVEDICADRHSIQFYSLNIINQPLSFIRSGRFADASYQSVRRRDDKRIEAMWQVNLGVVRLLCGPNIYDKYWF